MTLVIPTDDTCSAALPVFVNFSVSPELFVPVGVLGNVRLVGATVIAGCGDVCATVCGDSTRAPKINIRITTCRFRT